MASYELAKNLSDCDPRKCPSEGPRTFFLQYSGGVFPGKNQAAGRSPCGGTLSVEPPNMAPAKFYPDVPFVRAPVNSVATGCGESVCRRPPPRGAYNRASYPQS